MATNHIQEGAVITWTNGLSADVAAGDVVLIGNQVGVALGDIADGAIGEVAIEEVFEVPKNNSLVVSQGDILYWDATDEEMNKTEADNYLAGIAVAAAAETATTVKMKISPAAPVIAGT